MNDIAKRDVCYSYAETESATAKAFLACVEQVGFQAKFWFGGPPYEAALVFLYLANSTFVNTAAEVVMVGHSDVLPLCTPDMVTDMLGEDEVALLVFPPETEGAEDLASGLAIFRRSAYQKLPATMSEILEDMKRFKGEEDTSDYQLLRSLLTYYSISCGVHYLRDGELLLPGKDTPTRAEFHQEMPRLGVGHGYVYRDHRGKPLAINLGQAPDLRQYGASQEAYFNWRAYHVAQHYKLAGFPKLEPLAYHHTYGEVERAWRKANPKKIDTGGTSRGGLGSSKPPHTSRRC